MGTKELAKSCAWDALVDPNRVFYRDDDIEKDAYNYFVKTIADEDTAKEQERLWVQAVVQQIGQPNLAVVQPAQRNQSYSQQATSPPTLNWAAECVAKKTIKSELNKAKSAMARVAKENRNSLPHLASRLFGDKHDDDLEKLQEWVLLLRFCTLNWPTAQRKINDNMHPFQAASQDAHIWTLLGYVKQALDSMDQTDFQLLIARLKTWDTTTATLATRACRPHPPARPQRRRAPKPRPKTTRTGRRSSSLRRRRPRSTRTSSRRCWPCGSRTRSSHASGTGRPLPPSTFPPPPRTRRTPRSTRAWSRCSPSSPWTRP
ncbi:hypothetical protein AMAG_09553 [Allomyces macrogynus ATCC 38327]|uniref:Uncharacterized protein n=1 Tax=Allomyces macrogynus (strain ATCC 38327) TaxID=578462 RepID=A0A0L0SST7_ALLM3|nr:hypothetical protein AMAG_09553 [Allomyces macrogynus ATCC 38327]|eukprot:KNE65572.1 hypothetical protein AMAG_09553 [Allomyces macrogynus ATCC 38327]